MFSSIRPSRSFAIRLSSKEAKRAVASGTLACERAAAGARRACRLSNWITARCASTFCQPAGWAFGASGAEKRRWAGSRRPVNPYTRRSYNCWSRPGWAGMQRRGCHAKRGQHTAVVVGVFLSHFHHLCHQISISPATAGSNSSQRAVPDAFHTSTTVTLGLNNRATRRLQA